MIDKATHTAFSDAIETGDLETVKRLLRTHAEIVNHPDWTPPPIHCAILWDQPQVAELLIESGADIEMIDADRQTRPLAYAVVFCRPDLIRLLITHGAKTSVDVESGESLLQLAKRAASGAFQQYDDLPRPDEYFQIVELLEQLGVQ